MPYRGFDASEVKFVGTGSTYFVTNDYVDTGATFQTTFRGSFTISMWVKPDDGQTTESSFFGTRNSASEDWMHCNLQADGDIEVHYESDNDAVDARTDSVVFADGATDWTHLTVVADSVVEQLYIYINGVNQTLDGSKDGDLSSTTMSDWTSSDELFFGARDNNGTAEKFFNGSMKNVAIWNRALTATEVQNVMYKSYVNVSGRLASGLVSWWALDVDYTDSKGSNDGTNSGSTLNTDLYGGDTPVIPRAIDNARTVQADAIGAGSALFVLSNTDYIDTGATFQTTFDGSFSVALWIKVNDLDATRTIFGAQNAGSEDRLYCNIQTDGDVTLYYKSNNVTAVERRTTVSIVANIWTHICCVIDESADEINIYADGVLKNDSLSGVLSNITMSAFATIENLFIGARNDSSSTAGTHINGNISQVGIWSGALTQAQIQSVMEKTFEELTASEKTNLVSYWALDETVAGTELLGDADFSLTGNQATSTDSTYWGTESGWTISGGEAILTNSAGSGYDLVENAGGSDDNTAVATVVYQISYEITAVNGGSAKARIGDVDGATNSTVGTYTETITASSTSAFRMRSHGSWTGSINITNLSVKEMVVEDKQGSNDGRLI